MLYKDVLTVKTQAACERYLREAPLGERKRQVETYLQYWKRLQEPRNWTVKLWVEWDKRYNNWDGWGRDEHTIRVKIGPHQVLVKPYVQATPRSLSEVGDITISEKTFYNSVEISVEIEEIDRLTANDDAGSGSRTVKIEEMAAGDGARILLRPQNGGTFENVAYLRLLNPPVEPPLPDAPVPRW